jgi:hypothetical protein
MEMKMKQFKTYLSGLSNKKELSSTNTDLLNIRDEILADLNQFLYLMSLHGGKKE